MKIFSTGAKVDWDFRISDPGQKPWWNWCLTPVTNFGEVRRTQLAKSTLLTSPLVPLGSFQIFKVCSDAKERVECGKQQEATAPIKSLVKLRPWFLILRWKTCLRQNCSLGFSSCSEGPAFGQNTWWWGIKTVKFREKSAKLATQLIESLNYYTVCKSVSVIKLRNIFINTNFC